MARAVSPRAQRADHFSALVRAITFQQLSTKAAATIHGRLVALMPGADARRRRRSWRSPTSSCAAPGSAGRRPATCAISADKVLDGALDLDALDGMTDEEVIAALTQVKGIGRWSAEMFLMFRLHRPDVLPVGDLGIVTAIKQAVRLAQGADAGSHAEDRRSLAPVSLRRVLVSVAEPGERAVSRHERPRIGTSQSTLTGDDRRPRS